MYQKALKQSLLDNVKDFFEAKESFNKIDLFGPETARIDTILLRV